MRITASRFLSTVVILICTAFLAACSCNTGNTLPSPKPYSNTESQHYHMLKALNKEGVGVIEFGSTLTLILPTDCFFRGTTTQVKEHRKHTLRRIARLIKSYPGVPIYISGHTDKVYTRNQQQKNSFYYAQAVAGYLWNHGISPQQLKVIPDGSKVNVSTNKNPEGAADNRRVEIYIGLKQQTPIMPWKADSAELADHK